MRAIVILGNTLAIVSLRIGYWFTKEPEGRGGDLKIALWMARKGKPVRL
jgi:hypothetical protein